METLTEYVNRMRRNQYTALYVWIAAVLIITAFVMVQTSNARADARKNLKTLIARTDSLQQMRTTFRDMESRGAKLLPETFLQIDAELAENDAKLRAMIDSLCQQKLISEQDIQFAKSKLRQKSK